MGVGQSCHPRCHSILVTGFETFGEMSTWWAQNSKHKLVTLKMRRYFEQNRKLGLETQNWDCTCSYLSSSVLLGRKQSNHSQASSKSGSRQQTMIINILILNNDTDTDLDYSITNRMFRIGKQVKNYYFHIPFCVKKCHYCAFPIHALGENISSQ